MILLDVSMPGMDGFAVSQRLRSMPSVSEIPIVLLTARDHPEELERAAGRPLAGVISKPFQVVSLASELTGMLGWKA